MMQDADRARLLAEKAELEVRRHAEELARSNRDLEEFAYVTSHDLQEPLRSIVGFLQLLQRHYAGRLGADADEYISRSIEAAVRLRDRIQALLLYSRIGRQGQGFVFLDSTVSLNSAMDSLQEQITEQKAIVTHDKLPAVVADRSQLERLFQNLLGNALKFHGDEPLRIHIAATYLAEKKAWRFSVCDNGIGIEAKYATRIFGLFERLHSRTRYPGTGMGLSICKRIVEWHGGHIWVEAEPGVGSTFYFTLPDREEENVKHATGN